MKRHLPRLLLAMLVVVTACGSPVAPEVVPAERASLDDGPIGSGSGGITGGGTAGGSGGITGGGTAGGTGG